MTEPSPIPDDEHPGSEAARLRDQAALQLEAWQILGGADFPVLRRTPARRRPSGASTSEPSPASPALPVEPPAEARAEEAPPPRATPPQAHDPERVPSPRTPSPPLRRTAEPVGALFGGPRETARRGGPDDDAADARGPDGPVEVGRVSASDRDRLLEERRAALAPIEAEARACSACRLCEKRTQVAFSDGSPLSELMVIGEAPGHDEDVQGVPFVGAAGRLLTNIIRAMGLQREDVYIANIIKCRPPGNRNPTPDEIGACRPYLERQIEIVRPKVICVVGKSAGVGLGLMTEKDAMWRFRGRFHDYRPSSADVAGPSIPVMITYHPAYLLRNPDDKRKVWEDVQKIMPLLSEARGGPSEGTKGG